MSEPDADGQCTFTPPPGTAGRTPLDRTTQSDLLGQLRDGIELAKANRRAAVAHAPP